MSWWKEGALPAGMLRGGPSSSRGEASPLLLLQRGRSSSSPGEAVPAFSPLRPATVQGGAGATSLSPANVVLFN
jgi:hypothetical protein